MTVSVVLPSTLVNELEAASNGPSESAGVLLASVAEAPNGDVRLLARALRWVPDAAYVHRSHDSLGVRSEGYVHALAEAERRGATCIWVHTHPGLGASPIPSEHDRIVDEQLADVFRLRSGSAYYGALVFAPGTSGFTFSGHIQRPTGGAEAITRIWEVGSRLRLTRAFDSDLPPLPPIYDRHVRAFGGAIQHTLSDLRVAIVGCGGTGSAVGEQLARLGVRHFTLVDPDTLEASNTTRVYGSTARDVSRPKVKVLADHFVAINASAQCDAVQSMVTLETAARKLTSCDVVFGCTDDNAGRLVLSRLATYLLTPVVDCGVLLSSDASGHLVGIDGRVTVLTPGQGCLVCRGRIDLARASAEPEANPDRTLQVSAPRALESDQDDPDDECRLDTLSQHDDERLKHLDDLLVPWFTPRAEDDPRQRTPPIPHKDVFREWPEVGRRSAWRIRRPATAETRR